MSHFILSRTDPVLLYPGYHHIIICLGGLIRVLTGDQIACCLRKSWRRGGVMVSVINWKTLGILPRVVACGRDTFPSQSFFNPQMRRWVRWNYMQDVTQWTRIYFVYTWLVAIHRPFPSDCLWRAWLRTGDELLRNWGYAQYKHHIVILIVMLLT